MLRKCGAGKEKGIAIVQTSRYLMCLMFSDRSMYMEITTKRFKEDYSKKFSIAMVKKSSKIRYEFEEEKSECRSLSYDALATHVSIVFMRYMLLSVEKRLNEDDRTVGELFFFMVDELQDITFNQPMAIIVQAFLDSIQKFLHLPDEQIKSLLTDFVLRLPAYLRDSLYFAYVA